jgi:membrane protease YdiL (CAAX protease family)
LLRPQVRAAYRPTALHRWIAIMLAGAAFAAMHGLDAAPIIFVLALGLGYVYERTGNLWTAIVLHACFNGVQLVLRFSGG